MRVYREIKGNALGTLLRAYRTANRLTQQKVADYIGVERTSYAKYESGQRNPEISYILKLTVLYQVSLDDFLKDFFEEAEENAALSVASKPNEKNIVQVSEQELRLLKYYRDSMRKNEILKSAEEIFNQDKEIVEEINNI